MYIQRIEQEQAYFSKKYVKKKLQKISKKNSKKNKKLKRKVFRKIELPAKFRLSLEPWNLRNFFPDSFLK